MSVPGLAVAPSALAALQRSPESPVEARVSGRLAQVRIGIADYPQRIAAHYDDLIRGNVHAFAKELGAPIEFRHFGLEIEFASEVEIEMFRDQTLDAGARDLVATFGPVFIRNAVLPAAVRKEGHRGRFEDLNFHIDRSALQVTQYSLYTRDPDDPVQRDPRTASTLFIANLVALLQDARETGVPAAPCDVLPNHHTLFGEEDVRSLVGDIIFEQPWGAPAGTGEIGLQHNALVRHASWYRGNYEKGWPIGVQFLK